MQHTSTRTSSRSSTSGFQQHHQGISRAPDTYGLGPAPASLAGSSALSCFAAALSGSSHRFTASDALDCLQLMTAMTKLGRAMMSEAAGV
jgi:hypothetical protein